MPEVIEPPKGHPGFTPGVTATPKSWHVTGEWIAARGFFSLGVSCEVTRYDRNRYAIGSQVHAWNDFVLTLELVLFSLSLYRRRECFS